MRQLWLLMLSVLLCTGCQVGSASMRIDVEVYKGPLSKEPLIQFADLIGFLDEVQRSLADMADFQIAVILNKDFKSKSQIGTDLSQLVKMNPDKLNKLCDGLDAEGIWDQMDYFDCIVLRKLRTSTQELAGDIDKYKKDLERAFDKPNRSRVKDLLEKLSRVAGYMRKNPFSWTIPGTAGHTMNFKVRIAMVVYIVAMAEYGNQIHARADALMKQLAREGYDRRELPLSVYISDTAPTDFVHLFNQWDAATDRSWLGWTVGFVDGNVKDRINMVKRLFADHHWSKVNTVYASGWGKVRMALIKDDIGNWNLKSFDNAPEKLLSAYTAVAKTALDKAADLALTLTQDAASGGGASVVKGLVNISKSVIMPVQGEGGGSSAALAITDLHHRADLKLRETARAAIAEEEKQVTPDEKKKVQRQLINSLRLILQDHGELVDLSSKSVASSQ